MSENAPEGQGNLEEAQGTQEVAPPESTGTPSINPAWTELLGVVPSQLHSQVTPHLQKWDQNFQSKINEVHSQYEPWKQFIDNGVAPDDVQYSLGLLQALSENPQEVIKALNEWAGAENGTPEQQGQLNQSQQPGLEEDDPILSHPKVQEMQKGLETLAQIILSQRETEQQSAADAELENDIKTLKDTHGEFDEEIVLALAMQGDKFDYTALENAVKKVVAMNPPARQPGPPVLGNGAAPPADIPKPGNDAERRNLVAQMLAQAQRQQ